MWCETVGCDSPSGSMRLHTQTGPSFVASTFMIRTRAGSPSARKSSAVASVSSSESSGAPSGAQQAIASASIGHNVSMIVDTCQGGRLRGGRLAQLVERLLYTQEVTGSSPVPPIGKGPGVFAAEQALFAAPRIGGPGVGRVVEERTPRLRERSERHPERTPRSVSLHARA